MPWQRPHRFWRHAFHDERDVQWAFPETAMNRIETAIVAAEGTHRGQIGVAIEAALPLVRVLRKHTPRERALEVFGSLRVWDTDENNGVLIYLLLADRDVEIVADRGIHRSVGPDAWEAICRRMEEAFRAGHYLEGVEKGIGEIAVLLAQHFPGDGRDADELGNRAVVL